MLSPIHDTSYHRAGYIIRNQNELKEKYSCEINNGMRKLSNNENIKEVCDNIKMVITAATVEKNEIG